MAASIVEICNRALQKLGAARITSLSDQSTNARAVSQAYYRVRDAEFRKHPWNFAIQRFQLAASATPPAFGPTNSFPLPAGWMRLLPPDPFLNTNDRDWTIEGNQVLTMGGAPLNVRCVMKIEDTNLYDPLFDEALASKLAYELAEQLTQSNTKKEAAAGDYKVAIAEAKKVNGIEKVPQDSVEDTWITARINGGSPTGGGSWWSGA